MGLETPFARIPLVPGAVIYDLGLNRSPGLLPDEAMGYAAAAAATDDPVTMGNVGAGTGASAGKVLGFERAMKSGLGSSALRAGEIVVAALAVANPAGDIVDPDTGEILAGVRTEDGQGLAGALNVISGMPNLLAMPKSNTALGVVATGARLTKLQAARVARMAAVGFGRAIRPAHLLYDGDTVFALSTGVGPEADENLIGALAAEALARALAQAARTAAPVPGYPACRDLAR